MFPQLPTDTPEVKALCERLVPGEVPVILDVERPPWAKLNDCTANVERAIADYGGSVRYGWQLWETMPNVMIEAEFHAVWVDTDGGLRDITPKDFPFEQSVFLPDPTLAYEGKQIDNVRVALVDDPLIHDFIASAEAYYEATNRGKLATMHGDITPHLSPSQRKEIVQIVQRRERLGLQILNKYFLGH